MNIFPLRPCDFRLDGGAMFGVVPKTVWSKTNPADQHNRIELTARCLLVQHQGRNIIIDTGMGDKQPQKFFDYYDMTNIQTFAQLLLPLGLRVEDITDVILTHLHFDHSGGAFEYDDQGDIRPTFPQAAYWICESQWQWATEPNDREKASFLPENIKPFWDSGKLHLVPKPTVGFVGRIDALDLDVIFVDGHTEGQMLPILEMDNKKFIFAADLLPTIGHIRLPFVMGYDTRPLLTLEDRKNVYAYALEQGMYFILQHDAHHEICRLESDERHIAKISETLNFSDFN